jgi:hypothetical protein
VQLLLLFIVLACIIAAVKGYTWGIVALAAMVMSVVIGVAVEVVRGRRNSG